MRNSKTLKGFKELVDMWCDDCHIWGLLTIFDV